MLLFCGADEDTADADHPSARSSSCSHLVQISENLFAIPVDRMTRCVALESNAFSRYRMLMPFVARSERCEWPLNSACNGLAPSMLLSSSIDGTKECLALTAKDNRNFLRLGLCESANMSVAEALALVLGDSADTTERVYCRFYMDTQPLLLQDTDLDYLRQLVGCTVFTAPSFVPRNMGVWASSKGCVTPLHFDLCHGLLAQCVGRKRFLLASPTDLSMVYLDRSSTSNKNASRADLTAWLAGDSEQRRRFPYLSDVTWFVADLEEGDVLYTPPGWFHHVTSIDASVSVLVPFDPDPREQLPPGIN